MIWRCFDGYVEKLPPSCESLGEYSRPISYPKYTIDTCFSRYHVRDKAIVGINNLIQCILQRFYHVVVIESYSFSIVIINDDDFDWYVDRWRSYRPSGKGRYSHLITPFLEPRAILCLV